MRATNAHSFAEIGEDDSAGWEIMGHDARLIYYAVAVDFAGRGLREFQGFDLSEEGVVVGGIEV